MERRFLSWEQMAGYWDAKQGDSGDLWHRELINPAVFAVLGEVKGLSVLDVACGNGSLSRQMARMGARVTGVDRSEPIIALARAREAEEPLGMTYHAANAADLQMLPSSSFDAAVSVMALMDMPDDEAAGAVRESARVLKKGGRFVVCISHPCFDIGSEASGWTWEKVGPVSTVWRKVTGYREARPVPVHWRLKGEDELWHTTSWHRPLPWYFQRFKSAGLAVTDFVEPTPTEEFLARDSEGSWIAQVPVQCVFEAVKTR